MGVTPDEAERAREDAARRELFAVLAHELRSPIGAILGFEELLSEGILGEIPANGADALARIRGSARQLLDLVAGLNDLALEPDDRTAGPTETIPASELLADAIRALEPEAAGRDAQLSFDPTDTLPSITTDTERAGRALQLALMAAIKASAGARLRIEAEGRDGALLVSIEGSRLDPLRDDPDVSLHHAQGARLTGAGLRLAMARRALCLLGGELHLVRDEDATTLRLRLRG